MPPLQGGGYEVGSLILDQCHWTKSWSRCDLAKSWNFHCISHLAELVPFWNCQHVWRETVFKCRTVDWNQRNWWLTETFFVLQLLSNKRFLFDLQKCQGSHSFTVFWQKNNFFFLAHQPEASRPDFLMCGDTALFCYLLRSHGGRTSPFRDVPASGGLGRMKLKTFKFGRDLSLKTRWFFGFNIEGCICMAWCCCNTYQYPGATRCCRTGNDLAMIDTDWHKDEAKKPVWPVTPEIWKTKISLRGPVILQNICACILQSEHFRISHETTVKDAELLWVQIKNWWPLNTPPKRLLIFVAVVKKNEIQPVFMSVIKFGPIHPAIRTNSLKQKACGDLSNHPTPCFTSKTPPFGRAVLPSFSEDFGHSWNPLEPAGVQIEVLGLQLQWQRIVSREGRSESTTTTWN